MRQVKTTLGILCSAAMLMVATAAPAAAQTYDRVTKLTFSQPIELPGMTLPAGTYTFRLADSDSDRHIVEVLDADGAKLVTRLHAIPTSRSETSEVTVVTFRETSANAAPPIRFWYYPNDRMGQEFAYPKDRAVEIAQATGESVLALEGDEMARVDATPVTPEPAPVTEPQPQPIEPVTPVETQPTEPVQVEPAQPVEPASPVEPMATTPETQAVGTSGELPNTASPVPMVGLIGLLALGAAFSLRAYRRSAV